MATPTQAVTGKAQDFLGDLYDVALAVRVEWGADAAKNQGAAHFVHVWTPFVKPVMSTIQRRSIKRRMRRDPSAGVGVLALTTDNRPILLAAKPTRRKTPIRVVHAFPAYASIVPDVYSMEHDVAPSIRVGDWDLVMDRLDFKALLSAVAAGDIKSPELESNLERFKAVGVTRYG